MNKIEALKKDNLLDTNEVSAKEIFGIRSDLKVPQFINKSDNVFKLKEKTQNLEYKAYSEAIIKMYRYN